MCSSEDSESIPYAALELYKAREKDGFAAGAPTRQDCISLMVQLSSLKPVTMIVIDALDECCPVSRDELLEALDQIMDNAAGLIKILIASHDDRDIICHLKEYINITINANDNRTDIRRFIEHEVDTMIIKKDLLWGNAPPELEHLIKQTLCKKADEM